MPNIQVKNVSETLHRRLKNYAGQHNRTLSAVVLEALERQLARSDFHERLAQRPLVQLGVSAASLLEEERMARGEDHS